MKFQKGQKAWNKGLTKETDSRIAVYAKKHENTHPSDEARKRMSLAHIGKKLPKEQKKKISEAMKGNTQGFQKGNKNWLGKHHSEEARRKMSLSRFKYGHNSTYGKRAKRVLEKHYGIKWEDMHLPEKPCIHHIDENRHNNIFENLCVMSRPDHTRLHHPEIARWGNSAIATPSSAP
jgi:hypothetical protein